MGIIAAILLAPVYLSAAIRSTISLLHLVQNGKQIVTTNDMVQMYFIRHKEGNRVIIQHDSSSPTKAVVENSIFIEANKL